MGSVASDLKYHKARTEEKPPGGTRCAEILRLQRHSKTEVSEFFCSRWVLQVCAGHTEEKLGIWNTVFLSFRIINQIQMLKEQATFQWGTDIWRWI